MKNLLFKAIAIYLFFHFTSAFSCIPCGGFEQMYYEVEGVNLINNTSDDNNIFLLEELEENASVNVFKYVLVIQLDVKYFTDASPVFQNPFINSALACSPPLPEASELITGITLTSNEDLLDPQGKIIEAGTSLNDFFFRQNTSFTVTSLVFDGNWTPMEYGENLILNARPADLDKPHQFTIEYEVDSGNTFSATSEKVYLFY